MSISKEWLNVFADIGCKNALVVILALMHARTNPLVIVGEVFLSLWSSDGIYFVQQGCLEVIWLDD